MSFIESCINDTESIDLSFNDDNELEADLRLGSEATIEIDATGAQVRFGSTSGLLTDSNGLIVDTQLPGLARDANGVAKVTTVSGIGWGPGSVDDTIAHNFSVARGSNTTVGSSAFTLAVTMAQSIATRVIFMPYISCRLRTTWLGLGDAATNVNDEIGLILETNYNNAGWVAMDRFELVGNNQRTTANLKGIRSVSLEDGNIGSMQVRTRVTGGIISATAIQGVLERSFYRGMLAWW